MPRAFLSYSHADDIFVTDLGKHLQAKSWDIWQDIQNLRAGDRWPRKLGEAIAASEVFVLVWSTQAASSDFVDLEWTIAVSEKRPICILTLNNHPLPATLRSYQAHHPVSAETAAAWLTGITSDKPSATAAARVLEKLDATPHADPARIATELRRTLRGKVVKLQKGHAYAAVNARVTFEQTGETFTSNSAGLFSVPLLPDFLEGEEIKFAIEVRGYAIFQPVDGRVRIPRQLHKDVVTFELLPSGSPRFLSHEHLVALLKTAAEKSTEQVRAQKKNDPPVDLTRYLDDWARQYGLEIEQVKAEVDRWISTVEEKAADNYALGLAAFAKKNFAQASRLFHDSASQKERQLLRAREREQQLTEETIRDYRLAGDADYNDYNFRKAFESYQKALSLADNERTPQLWAAMLINCGNAKYQLGIRTDGEEAVSSLHEARVSFERALQVYTRAQLPQDWATTQNSLGAAFRDLAGRSEGAQAVSYLQQAVDAFRNALQVRTHALLPQDWAMTQNNLGAALSDRAARSEGVQAASYLQQAVEAYQNALYVYTRAQLPQPWATIQNNLGNALSDLAGRSEGTQVASYLQQAVEAYRNALDVLTRALLPQPWATTQNNLGVALRDLAGRCEGAQTASYLQQAVDVYRTALQVRTRALLPQDWAMTQNNLGTALSDMADRCEGTQATTWLDQAVAAYRSALEVRTETNFPLHWTRTMQNLALAYEKQKDWPNARETYAKLLHHDSNNSTYRAKVKALAQQQ